jgi:hypothetical protein
VLNYAHYRREVPLPPGGLINIDKQMVDDPFPKGYTNPQAGVGINESNKMAQLLARAQGRQQQQQYEQQAAAAVPPPPQYSEVRALCAHMCMQICS